MRTRRARKVASSSVSWDGARANRKTPVVTMNPASPPRRGTDRSFSLHNYDMGAAGSKVRRSPQGTFTTQKGYKLVKHGSVELRSSHSAVSIDAVEGWSSSNR